MLGQSEGKRQGEERDGAEVGDGNADGAPEAGDDGAEAAVEEEMAAVIASSPESEEDVEEPAQRLAEELDALNDRHLRLAAEFENFRKRTRREQAELASFAQADLIRRILPTVDDLARVAATPSDSTTVEALERGLELILRNLLKVLEEAGLSRVEAEGQRFNPEAHEAIMTAQTEDLESDDTVSRVFVDGYTFRGRLVRPAQVEVLTHDADGAGET